QFCARATNGAATAPAAPTAPAIIVRRVSLAMVAPKDSRRPKSRRQDDTSPPPASEWRVGDPGGSKSVMAITAAMPPAGESAAGAHARNRRGIYMSMVTTTYPLAGAVSERPHTAAAIERRAWGFWATTGWFGLAIVGFVVASFLTGFGYAIWWVLTAP